MPSSPPPISGIALRVLAVFLITAMSALIHAVGPRADLGQIIFWRSAVALVPIVIYMALRGQFPAAFKTRRPGVHITRGLFGAASMAFSFISLIYLPVANAQALAYLAPVLTLPLAAHSLRERLSPPVIAAVCCGFAGAMLILWNALEHPGAGAQWGVLAGLAYAVTMAFVRVHIKAMTATESPASIAFYFALICSLIGLATLPLGWSTLSIADLTILIVAGILGGLAHIASTEAVARAPVSTIAPIDFTGLIWAIAFDFALFGVVPDWLAALGMAAILGAALLVLGREIRAMRAP